MKILNHFIETKYSHVIEGHLFYPGEVTTKNRSDAIYPRMSHEMVEGGTEVKFKMREAVICREYGINSVRRALSGVITEPINGKLKYPDWNYGSSKLVFMLVPGKEDAEDRMGDFGFLLREITAHMMAEIFGESAYNQKHYIDIANVPYSDYSSRGFKETKCTIIDFPNCFMSSPAALSLWISMARKAIRFCMPRADNTHYVKAKKVIEDHSGSFESMLPIIKHIQWNSRDPLWVVGEVGVNSNYIMPHLFPVEFFMFALKEADVKERVFGQKTWQAIGPTLNGYRTIAYRFYRDNSGVRERFKEYLKELGHQKRLEKFSSVI